MAGLKDYWKVKGEYLSYTADPANGIDSQWLCQYMSRATQFGKTRHWRELSAGQQDAVVRRGTLREFRPSDDNEDETFRFNIECTKELGEMYVLLSGTCLVEYRLNEKSYQEDLVRKLGQSFGAMGHFERAAERMFKRRERLAEDLEKDEEALMAELEKRDKEEDEEEEEDDGRRIYKIVVTGKKASFLKIALSDYVQALEVGLKQSPLDALREKMTYSQRRFHDLKMAMKAVQMDAAFMHFLEHYHLVGRVVVFDDGSDDLQTKYYRTAERGHVTNLRFDMEDSVYIFLSGSVQLNIKPTTGDKTRVLELEQPGALEAKIEGKVPAKTISTRTRTMPLLQLVPGSTVCLDRTLFHLPTNGAVDEDGSVGSYSVGGYSINSSSAASSVTRPGGGGKGILRKKDSRQAPGMIRKREKKQSDYLGPFFIEMVFDKRCEYFEIPIRVIKKCLKEESYSVTSMVYQQLFQASTLVKNRVGQMVRWLQPEGLKVTSEGNPLKEEEDARIEAERCNFVGAYATDDFLFARPTDGGLLGTFKRVGVRGRSDRRKRTSEHTDTHVSQSASLPAGAFKTLMDVEAEAMGDV